MEIYLTFDDGINAGTEEVLEVLNYCNVSATFFIIGISCEYFLSQNESKFMSIFEDIYTNHATGNHSYSHGYNDYDSYYQIGTETQNFDNIFQDFKKNAELLAVYHKLINVEPNIKCLSKRQINPLARFPAKNNWRVNVDECYKGNSLEGKCIYKNDIGTSNVADRLFKRGYQIYGWDIEWRMMFDFYKLSLEIKKNDPHSDFMNQDMYENKFSNFDRLTESAEEILNKTMQFDRKKTIILMHDRAFRNNSREVEINGTFKSSYQNQLFSFIQALKNLHVSFKTLDNYVDGMFF